MSSSPSSRPLELWGGPECTVNRVADAYFDQVELSGHAARLEDLDRFAALGLRAIRYPVLWERTAPRTLAEADWSWPDERLTRLRDLGVRPIVGLVHHGSGPPHTSLLDPAFPEHLAAYARAVAERYPWVEAWTPVNEPLTTARFSCLYGYWYPHRRDDASFVRALLTECRATVLAMRAIREVIPGAQLVQTEDLGKTFSTPQLAYQAAFENERRWLTFDLLCGRLDVDGLVGRWLRERAGVDEADLEWFREHPCPPDVVGINHYLSSERFLDERLERYPLDSHGGNGREQYADVLAARVLAEGPAGPEQLLRETWERYRLPIAVTEAHNGCTREEQLRWLDEVWLAASALQGDGVDIRAVCLWTLLGAFGWDTLVASCDGRYEPGVFDLRSDPPRPTAIARMARSLASTGAYDEPVLETPGWWRRAERLWYAPESPREQPAPWRRQAREARPLLVIGARGTLARAFARIAEERGLPYRLAARPGVDLAVPGSVAATLEAVRPWAVVNAAGYVRVDDAELEPEACARANADGAAVLAAACALRGIPLVTFSSDLVFDGRKGAAYVESDSPAPLSVYGQTKADAERRVLAAFPDALVVRTSAFFGPWDEHNFVTVALRELAAGRAFAAADDLVVSPTYVPDLVQATLDLLIDGDRGIWHLANPGAVTWAELAGRAAELAEVDTGALVARPARELGLLAERPTAVPLTSERGILLPALEDALGRYVAESELCWEASPDTAPGLTRG